MRKPFPEVGTDMTLSELGKHITKENPAVVTTDRSGRKVLVAQYDILQAI
jgi:cystathionine beta-synthase